MAEWENEPLEAPPASSSSAGAARADEAADGTEAPRVDDDFERQLHEQSPLLWWGTVVGPPAVTGALLLFAGLTHGFDYVATLLVGAASAFFVFGRFAIILGGQGDAAGEAVTILNQLSGLEWFALILYMDLLCAVLWAFHIDLTYRIPWVGPRFHDLTRDGERFLAAFPWVRRATFLANVVFVTFPLAGTGSIGGSIFGRLLGLSRWQTFAAVATGAVVGNGAMYFFGAAISAVLPRGSAVVTYGGIVALALLLIGLNLLYQRWKAGLADESPHASDRQG